MLKTVEDISTTKKRLKIEIPSDTIEGEIQSGLKGVQKKAKIPGFRPGKAPISIIEKRFGKDVEGDVMERLVPEYYSNAISIIEKRFGKDVEGDVMERLVPEYYSNALKEANIKPVGRPEIEEKLEIKRNAPLEMTLTVEIRPEVKDLKYEGVKVKGIPVEVKGEEVEDALKDIQQKRTMYEPTEDAAGHGDMVVMDYQASEEGKEYNEFKDHTYKVGHGVMPEAFSKEIEGMKKGDEKEFNISFPEDFPTPDVAGKEVSFKVSLKEIKKPVLPEVDDEFAKDLGFDDLAALKSHVEDQIKKSKEASAKKMQKAEVVSKILADHPFDTPESMVAVELQMLVAQARQSGRNDDTDESLREEFKSAAENHVKATILLDIIGEKENIEVTEEEAKQRVDAMAAQIGMTPENIMKYYIAKDGSMDGLRNEVFEEKVLDVLLERAEISKGDKE
jgi:trigger factor